jgi:hypothetical protein
MCIKTKLRTALTEGIIQIPEIPNTRNFFHGGNLDEYNDVIAQKNGRYEYGPGLYLTTRYDIATKYSKGSRKLYIISVEGGTDLNDSFIEYNSAIEFINTYTIKNLRKEIIERLNKYNNEGKVKAYIFNNILLNEKAIKPAYTKHLREFYIKNNIDYEIVHNAFGFHDDMMVLYNMKKIKNILQVKSGDKLPVYEL